ncbi:hypothetical protein FO519_004182 [Halicephalobus sp. NKZ332]|nr:hypothetical protein FO519_004182 [Halicephalobus sp. NKZ332]
MGPDLPDPSNFSDDEEPQSKRRRTISDSSEIFFPASETPFSALSPCSTVDSDAQLIPSSTDSECGGSDPDTIPFDPKDYVSFNMSVDLETKTYPTVENWTTVGVSNACGKQHLDIGYSSGENSLTESPTTSPTVSSGGTSPDSERKVKIRTNSTKSFYKTVPLDEGGLTDNENSKNQEKEIEVELPVFDEPLSDSLIVQMESTIHQENNIQTDNDFNEVISMLDDESENLFNLKLEQLQKGTHWKELKSKNKRISTPRRSLPGFLDRDHDKSREASSEESDSGKNKNSILNKNINPNPAALPPVPGRKRRFKKVIKNKEKGGSMEILKNSLSNVAMDESIYVYTGSNDLMSQSLNSSFNDSNSRRTILSKRKFDKTRMHRSASDHVNINLSINNLSNSFHSQHSSTSVFASFLPNFGTPLMSSTLKRDSHLPRRPSAESLASSTSSGTVHENGDAHYEWDEYRDPPSFPEMSTVILPDPSASTSSILGENFIDEDFQSQLPLLDPTGIDSALNESKNTYNEVRRIINDYGILEEENEGLRDSLRSSAKHNFQKLTAIVQASPRHINMDQVNEVEDLRKQWKYIMEELGPDPIEEDQVICNEIQSRLSEIKSSLRKLMEVEVASLKLENLEELIFERKSLWQNLMENKRVLTDIAETTGNKYKNEELLKLLKYVEDSLGFVGEGTDTLTKSMFKYLSMGDLRKAMMDLEIKMDNMERGNEGIMEQVESELDLCQERLNALETVCNELTSQLGEVAALNGKTKPGKKTKFWKEFKGFKSEFQRLKEKFSRAKASSELANGAFGGVRRRLLKATDSSTSAVSSKTDSGTQPEVQVGFFGRVLNSIKDSKFLKILLGLTGFLLICLIFVTFYFEDTPQNNWKRMFGPQLEYINGRPPS